MVEKIQQKTSYTLINAPKWVKLLNFKKNPNFLMHLLKIHYTLLMHMMSGGEKNINTMWHLILIVSKYTSYLRYCQQHQNYWYIYSANALLDLFVHLVLPSLLTRPHFLFNLTHFTYYFSLNHHERHFHLLFSCSSLLFRIPKYYPSYSTFLLTII